jgi:hypothetical protein
LRVTALAIFEAVIVTAFGFAWVLRNRRGRSADLARIDAEVQQVGPLVSAANQARARINTVRAEIVASTPSPTDQDLVVQVKFNDLNRIPNESDLVTFQTPDPVDSLERVLTVLGESGYVIESVLDSAVRLRNSSKATARVALTHPDPLP